MYETECIISRSTMGAPHRRTIYMASLEAHIDRLHNHLLSFGLYPVPFSRLEPYRGLNSKTAKVRQLRRMFITIFPHELVIQSMVSGLQHDATQSKLKLLELDRAVRPCPWPHAWVLTLFPEFGPAQAPGQTQPRQCMPLASVCTVCPLTRGRCAETHGGPVWDGNGHAHSRQPSSILCASVIYREKDPGT